MPSVTRNDGILSRVTNQAVDEPDEAAARSGRQEGELERRGPVLNRVHIRTGEKPNTEPTERSNSPAVISSVIAQGDEAELDREGQRVADVAGRQEMRVDRGEDDQLERRAGRTARTPAWRSGAGRSDGFDATAACLVDWAGVRANAGARERELPSCPTGCRRRPARCPSRRGCRRARRSRAGCRSRPWRPATGRRSSSPAGPATCRR